jgi:hypothetical protein
MTSAITKTDMSGLEQVLISGDLSSLSPDQAVQYYARVCASVGLNPLTQPFEYLKLNGKMVLYARRAAADQLRQIHNVSITIVSREKVDGCYVVTARATLPSGRCDESVGAVPIEGLKGETLANAVMKTETKAKRRVTLAICGLALLDESELEGVHGARSVNMADAFPVARLPATQERDTKPDNVVPIRAEEPTTVLDGDEKRTVYEMFAGKLRQRQTAEELVAWLKLFMATEYPPEVRAELQNLFRRHARALRLDPNMLVLQAQKGGSK